MVTYEATDIVVTSVEPTAGRATVLEPWRGHVAAGTRLLLPDLAAIGSESRRTVILHDRATRLVVGTDRVVLFLRKNADGTFEFARRIQFATVFLGFSQAYAPSLFGSYNGLGPLGLDATGLHAHVSEIDAFTTDLVATRKIADLARRAEALVPLVTSGSSLRSEAVQELRSCGKAALPTLRKLIARKSLLALRAELLALLVEAAPEESVTDVRALLVEETRFFRAHARSFEGSWWQGAGLASQDELDELLGRLNAARIALGAADGMEDGPTRAAATELRALWRTDPAYKAAPELLGLPDDSVAAR
ncbi:MAG TPA: hypothetical protein VFF73_13865 [Planctomycetota bacterium]|nr:hypothetical protein [Planctomycetota bacterium]